MFEAKVIEDSVSEAGVRLTTMQLRYPRFIHAECKTHRILNIDTATYELLEEVGFMDDRNLSRNASSSRAIPVAKMLKQVRENPAMPIHWGKNQPGMQAREECNELVTIRFDNGEVIVAGREEGWRIAAGLMANAAEAFMNAGYHKQVVNRLLECFQFMHVVVSATSYDNFYQLRDHEDADPNIQALAKVMKAAQNASSPKLVKIGEWHLPYVSAEERTMYPLDLLKKLSTARCARVSFLNHDQSAPVIEKDCDLYDKLVVAKPVHASPTEHPATPFVDPRQMSGNYFGWYQHREEV